jgi:hypothetical protein
MSTAEYKRQVLRYAKAHGLEVAMPSTKCRIIIVTDWRSGFGKQVCDGTTWRQIFDGLRTYQMREFGL